MNSEKMGTRRNKKGGKRQAPEDSSDLEESRTWWEVHLLSNFVRQIIQLSLKKISKIERLYN